ERVLLLRRQPTEGTADNPPIGLADDVAGRHRKPQRLAGELEPHPGGELRLHVASEAQPAAALREVDEVAASADHPAARVNDQDGASTELDPAMTPSFDSSIRFHGSYIDTPCAFHKPPRRRAPGNPGEIASPRLWWGREAGA